MEYRIVCTIQTGTPPHGHITRAGTGAPSGWTKLWTVQEIYDAMNIGHTFHTVSPSTGKRARVRKWACGGCNVRSITTEPDHVTDNNLDNLPECKV